MSLQPDYVLGLSDSALKDKIKEAEDMIRKFRDDKEIVTDYKIDLKQLRDEEERRDAKDTTTEDRFKSIETRLTALENRQSPEKYNETIGPDKEKSSG